MPICFSGQGRWLTQRIRLLGALLGCVFLSGCYSDAASYLIGDSRYALTLIRSKSYFWSPQYELEMVIARLPDCQRRYPLAPAAMGHFRLDVFYRGEDYLVLKQGEHLYRVDEEECVIDEVSARDAGPLVLLLGHFEGDDKNRSLRFVSDR